MPDDLIELRRPELGRPTDPRITQEYIDARPELAGVTPFDPDTDVDLVGEISSKLAAVQALVVYADPELGEQVQRAAEEADAAAVRAREAALQAANQLGSVTTQLNGVQVGSTTAAPLGGTIITLTPAQASSVTATVQPAAHGGTLISLGGTNG
ncbi:hypothetical protein [Deinococcus petrolearius]|uniref:Uncharacterized protein n=1 Tax=Deinococcus petrolearius TaxID=1751295 RepID=A0ABW1DGC1_9DEIO